MTPAPADLYEILRALSILEGARLAGNTLQSPETTDPTGKVLGWAEITLSSEYAQALVDNGYVGRSQRNPDDPHLYPTRKAFNAYEGLQAYYKNKAIDRVSKSGLSNSNLLTCVAERSFWTIQGCPEDHPRKNEVCLLLSNPFGENFVVFRNEEMVVLPKTKANTPAH